MKASKFTQKALIIRQGGQSRSTQRRQPKRRADEVALTEAIVRLATRYGRYGYRRIRRLLLEVSLLKNIKT